ncbi:MAG TPA: hypothetical protein VEK08_26815 [Planctomycetota bacterium]|nr:hypothetical protein [Planctomycetota bacterium]
MRQPSKIDHALHVLLALALLAPLLIAFAGQGGFADAFGSYESGEPGFAAARKAALVAATGRSLLVGILATGMALLIGIPAGWALSEKSGGGLSRKAVLLLVVTALPLALPASVSVSGWVGLFAPAGVASRFNVPIPGFAPESRGWLFSEFGAALVLASSLWPIIALETWPGFRRSRNEAYEAALLYSSRGRSFLRIVLPQVAGEIAAGALLVFLFSSTDFSVSSLLLVRTLPTEVHDALMLGKTASAAWASMPLLLLIGIVAWLSVRVTRDNLPQDSPRDTREMPSGLIPLSVLSAGILLGFVLPMAVCFVQAQNTNKPLSVVFGAGTEALGSSLRIAAAVAVISIIAAIARTVLWPETRTRPINIASLFLLAIPGSFLAAALLAIELALSGTLNGTALATALPAATFAAALVIRFLYIPLRLVEEGLAALDPDLLDAAALAGHGRLSRAVSIALPLILPHILAASALVFIFALGEVPMSSRLAPPGLVPATVWLFQQQHMGYDEAVFGLSLLLGGVVAGVLLLCGTAALIILKWTDRARAPVVEGL